MRTLSEYRKRALLIGWPGLALTILFAFLRPDELFASYLIVYQSVLAIALGAMGFLMIYRMTGGVWGARIERFLKASSGTFVLLALLFIPILFGLRHLYPWMNSELVAQQHELQHKRFYLNAGFFIARSVVYLGCWIALSLKLLRTRPEDAGPVSAGGFVLLSLTSTFSAFDWSMSIEPSWASTIYGLIFLIGQGLSGFAFCLVALRWGETRLGWDLRLTQKPMVDLANVLLALLVLWAYLSFMQYLIIWSGNIPAESTWYLHRARGGWEWVVLVLALFQVVAPIVMLLFRRLKRKPEALALVGIFLLGTRLLELYWLIVPAYRPESIAFFWLILLVLPGVGGLWVAAFLRELERYSRDSGGDATPLEPASALGWIRGLLPEGGSRG